MKPQSQRQLRVGENIRHILAELFLREDLYDPENSGLALNLVTVSQVQISPDLKNATIYIMPLSGVNQDSVLASLKRLQPIIRHKISRKLTIRYTPYLSFTIDKSFDRSDQIDHLLSLPKVKSDIRKI